MHESDNSHGSELPSPPAEPVPGECCGCGCERCVYVCYEEALERWKAKVAAIKQMASEDSAENQ